ncbi:MAG: hypothetical protein D6775_01605 [Caldilineae bacterium]|nr:MAG: hypothetical protein D6775_01605 [Caldilineae bacterium]
MLRTEPTILDEYVATGIVKLQFWHILDHGNASIQASAAAECAGEQGAFWAMHDTLFENQSRLWGGDQEVLADLAAAIGLDTAAFRQCMQGQNKQQWVQDVDREVKARGVRRRPTFDIFVQGERVQRLEGSPAIAAWRELLNGLVP